MDVPQKFNHLKNNSSKRNPEAFRQKKAKVIAADKAARKKARQTAHKKDRRGTAGTSARQDREGGNSDGVGAVEGASSDEMVD